MKPNLFIVGAPKCGTTAWHHYLRQHPDIFFPELKEPHYFAPDFPKLREADSLDDYLALFEPGKDRKIVGEASVFYMYSEAAAGLIANFNPHARILAFVRDQEFFIPSFHQQLLFTLDDEMEDFNEAWALSGRRPPETVPATCRDVKVLDYRKLGRIADQLDRYSALFPGDRIGIVRFDDWVKDPRSMYVKILAFLGLEDDGRDDFPPVNQARFHKSRSLARFLQDPPAPIAALKRRIKRLLGVPTLGIAEKIARFNREPGYTERPSPELVQAIADHYRAEGQRIDQLRQRPL